MKKNALTIILVAVLFGLIGYGLGRSANPVNRAIRKAQRLSRNAGIQEKREAIELINQAKTAYIGMALQNVKLEETKKLLALSLGKILVKHEMWLEALIYLEMSRDVLPGDFTINYNLGITYSSLYNLEQSLIKKDEYYKKAIDVLSIALQSKPKNADANYLMGIMLYQGNLYSEALSRFQTVIDNYPLEMYPDTVGSYMAAGRIYFDSGEVEKAKKYFLKAENVIPPDNPKYDVVQKNLEIIERELQYE